METREESSLAVLRLFGREPLVEDWRCVGRWAYAAAWVSEDRATAREVVRARLGGAAALATAAALAAGRGDTDRFVLVSAIARLKEAFGSSEGAFGTVAERAVDEAAGQLASDGNALRSATYRERAAFAPRFGLEGFAAAMLDVGPERNVQLREAARTLDEALLTARGACPALRTLRLFLHASLAFDTHDATVAVEAAPMVENGDPLVALGLWLSADLALAARRATAYEAAWSAAARVSGDALSRAVAGLSGGSMLSKGLGEALQDDPMALLLVLAMTSEGEHASALLDLGVHAQTTGRIAAEKEVKRWTAAAQRVDDLESKLGISILAPVEARAGHREQGNVGGLDLFAVWRLARRAGEARVALREATSQSIAAESARRKEAARRAKATLERARQAYEEALDAARAGLEALPIGPTVDARAEESAQRGCVFGFGAGCSVIATYAVLGLVIGTGGLLGRIAPIVVAVAALPVLAAVVAQVAVAMRRAVATADAHRRRTAASKEYERARMDVEKDHAGRLAEMREALSEAEGSLRELLQRLAENETPTA